MPKAIKGAPLTKHATTSQARKMLEKKIRDKWIAEHLETKKSADKLLNKNRRFVKTVDGFREKAMSSSQGGARITISQANIVKGVETGVWRASDVLSMHRFLGNHYSYTRVKDNA